MRNSIAIIFCLGLFSLQAQIKNTELIAAKAGQSQSVAIVINHKDSRNIVVSGSSGILMVSADGGKTWAESVVQSPLGFYGSSSLISDLKGHLFFAHNADPGGVGNTGAGWLDRITIHESEDGGKTWTAGNSTIPVPSKNQVLQKPVVNPRKNSLNFTWTEYDKYGSEDNACLCYLMFSTTTSAGAKWSKPIQINQNPGTCLESNLSLLGATPSFGLDGRVFMIWALQEMIFLDRSYDGGETWLTNDVLAARQVGGASMQIPGLGATNGLPGFVVDASPNRSRGSLYMVFPDQKNGQEDSDIIFLRSVNHGDNWTAPLRLNKDEPGKQQFSPVMTVDPASGFIYVAYFDRRAYDDAQTDVYLAYSFDSGNVFREQKISESPFTPTDGSFAGTRIAIAAQTGTISVVWTRVDERGQSVWNATLGEVDLQRK